MVDHLGRLVDGDQLLYIIARERHQRKELVGPVVGTVMSNLGLEHALAKEGIQFRRAKVGDRYVLEMLKDLGGMLGGETSGHLLCLDRTTTGDALISALQVLQIMKETKRSLAELAAPMPKYPQVLENVRVATRIDPAKSPQIQEAVARAEGRLGTSGRIVLRPSGTEPVIRVMVEGSDDKLVREIAKELAATVASATKAA
jgi:phosphoglucosamine mutase